MGAIKYIVFLLILLVLGVCLGLTSLWYLTLPNYNETVYVGNNVYIQNDIHIHRDQYAIPHIKAHTFTECMFGLGYVHAQDRLWQMHMRRMAAQGRLSEMFGEKSLKIDMFYRNLYVKKSAQNIVDKLDSSIKNLLQSYADGINQGRKSLKMLPIEFQILGCEFHEWTIFDSIVFHKFLSILKINDYVEEFLRSEFINIYGRESAETLGAVGPDHQYNHHVTVVLESELKDLTTLHDPLATLRGVNYTQDSQKNQAHDHDFIRDSILPDYLSEWLYFSSEQGSNAWSVHGNHTDSGYPQMAGDPHLDNQMPSMWYTAEIIWQENGEEQFATGAQFPGLPAINSGRNKYIAWGITILNSDGADFWEEKITKNSNGSYSYEYKGEQLPVTQTQEVIRIKNQKEVGMTILHTHHGPLIDQFGSKFRLNNNSYYSLQTMVHLDDSEGQNLIHIMRVKDIKSGLELLSRISYPNLGMTMISHDNHIGFIAVGKLVIRDGNPDQGAFVKQGWTGENEWIGFVSQEEQPIIIDPPKGYFALANNKYVHTNNKYYLGWNSIPTSRGLRISEYFDEKISKGEKITMRDHIKLQLDTFDPYSKNEQHKMIELIELVVGQHVYDEYLLKNSTVYGLNNKQVLKSSFEILRNWDFYFSEDSVAASLTCVFEFTYQKKLLESVYNHEKNQFLSWSTYFFDSFHFNNIDQMYQAIKENKNLSILASNWCVNKNKYPCVFSIVESIINSYQFLSERYGSKENWTWTNLHSRNHPHVPFKTSPVLAYLFNRKYQYKGYRRSVLASKPTVDDQMSFNGEHGPNYRMVISMAPKEKSFHLLDTGISGNVFSSHYDDQLRLFSRDEYIEMTHGSENLSKNKYHTILKSTFLKEEI